MYESKFSMIGSVMACIVWRKLDEVMKPEFLMSTAKHGGGHVMVWGSMAASGVGIFISLMES